MIEERALENIGQVEDFGAGEKVDCALGGNAQAATAFVKREVVDYSAN
ncbi:MAG: hypothetical protein ACRERD_07415 [Candidatus Binatia bacterium]